MSDFNEEIELAKLLLARSREMDDQSEALKLRGRAQETIRRWTRERVHSNLSRAVNTSPLPHSVSAASKIAMHQ